MRRARGGNESTYGRKASPGDDINGASGMMGRLQLLQCAYHLADKWLFVKDVLDCSVAGRWWRLRTRCDLSETCRTSRKYSGCNET